MSSNSSPMIVTASIYALLVLIWATTPLAIVWSVEEVHPMWVLIIRYFGASLIALFLLKLMRDPLPLDETSLKSYVAGSLNLIGAQLFIYLAANYLTSGLMALIFGFSPLIAGLIGHVILKTQKLVALQWLGMAVAVAALMVAVSVIIGVGVMIGSFRQTVELWLDDVLQADIFISSPIVGAGVDSAGLAPALENLTMTLRPWVMQQNLGCSPPADDPGSVPCSAPWARAG